MNQITKIQISIFKKLIITYNNNIIDKSLDNIINSKDKNNYNNNINININNDIFNNNNKIYFTEAAIKLQKSNSTNLHEISSISEYPNGYPKYKLNILKKAVSPERYKNYINEKLNNLSPKDYMKKRFVNKYNFQPLQYRIKKMEEEIEKQNKYDYERFMKETQLKYYNVKKNKEKQKNILEFHKKTEEKLKNMEIKRNILYNQRLEKIQKKQKNSNSISFDIDKSRKYLNKSYDDNYSNNIQNNMTVSNKIRNTIDSYGHISENNRVLPLIHNLKKYQLLKMIRDKKEEKFCNHTLEKINENDINHRRNYLKQINSINNKLIKKNILYRQRSMQCLKATKTDDEKLKSEFIAKDMIKRYKIKEILNKEHSAKTERVKYDFIKKYDDAKEKRKNIEKQNEEKIKQVIKRINRNFKKKEIIGNNREFFSNLQKKNLRKHNKDNYEYYNELISRQGEIVFNIKEFQKDEPVIKREIFKRYLQEQNKKSEKLKSLDRYLNKMERININNQNDKIKKKIYKEKIKHENDLKRKEEENEK